jgi:ABC-2 type transport system permease protein
MMPTIKSEIRKLFTMRWTYYILAFCLVLMLFFGFYISGWKIDHADLLNPNSLANDVTGAVGTLSIFVSLIAILLFANEYRYNTIMYTLTSSNSRTKVLLSKILVITGFSVAFTLIVGILAPVLSNLGVHAHHLTLVHQTYHYGDLAWRSFYFGWCYAMAGLVIAALTRSQVGALVTIFIFPSVVESLIGLALKNNSVYLPFTSLATLIGTGANYRNSITPFHAALVFTTYLVVGLGFTWYLFLKRDAT